MKDVRVGKDEAIVVIRRVLENHDVSLVRVEYSDTRRVTSVYGWAAGQNCGGYIKWGTTRLREYKDRAVFPGSIKLAVETAVMELWRKRRDEAAERKRLAEEAKKPPKDETFEKAWKEVFG